MVVVAVVGVVVMGVVVAGVAVVAVVAVVVPSPTHRKPAPLRSEQPHPTARV